MAIDHQEQILIIEGGLLAAGKPMTVDKLANLFPEDERPDNAKIKKLLAEITKAYHGRAMELREVASGFTFFLRQELGPWLTKLWEEKPQKYTRSLLETLAIIAYRQPVTRADIEQIRGVAVSTNTTRTLIEREWVRIVGHRDVLGKPALYATTKAFLDYFGMKCLEQLPPLSELKDFGEIELPQHVAAMMPAENAEHDETEEVAEREIEHEVENRAEIEDRAEIEVEADVES